MSQFQTRLTQAQLDAYFRYTLRYAFFLCCAPTHKGLFNLQREVAALAQYACGKVHPLCLCAVSDGRAIEIVVLFSHGTNFWGLELLAMTIKNSGLTLKQA
jgi:hypothetical protein